MNSNRTTYKMMAGIASFLLIIFVLSLVFFSVNPREQYLVLRFGEVVRVVTEPGLQLKVPVIDRKVRTDKRILDFDMPWYEITTEDQKRIIVDVFARYKITDPVKHYSTVATTEGGNERLSTFLQSDLRAAIGKKSFDSIVKEERAEIMSGIEESVRRKALDLGIQIVDVKIKGTDLPPENSVAIYERMKSERKQEAAGIRAEGEEKARKIRASADYRVTVILAEAKRDAEKIRGDGDKERNRIFAETYQGDPEFFEFYRTMQSYEASLIERELPTNLILSSDSPFFKFFGDGQLNE